MRLAAIREKLCTGLFGQKPLSGREPIGRDREAEVRALLARAPFGIAGISDAALPLYDRALTHRSCANGGEYPVAVVDDNERLEFLGNYVLDFIIADHLYGEYDLAPGEMNRRLQVTRNTKLAEIVLSQGLGIDGIIRRRGQALTDSVVADAFEALIGAIYLDRGLETARGVVLAIFEDEIADCDVHRNYRGRLQEYAARKNLGTIEYAYRQTGPGSCPVWAARVTVGGAPLGEGKAPTKQGAAMLAAREALAHLGEE
ncbi:ribonuclease III family protein [Methanoculleus sp. Wushi-C6]|uniref:Ribonuclease III family protein n=1 Tax=Methanoculleus caldifontis TaxID=2651577 RepID=A0ABU3X045_9EURY|nr:ribonuclease III domain-containing protein [Methanoculleus sp. Wushi-C6]MDV2481336.1 ribonuclease III family protein [Methanoculleus sp. Wushi-C6]